MQASPLSETISSSPQSLNVLVFLANAMVVWHDLKNIHGPPVNSDQLLVTYWQLSVLRHAETHAF
jgi:hypothetical protein